MLVDERGRDATVAARTDRLRILHVLNHVRRTGNGIVNVAVDLACAQAAAGHDVLVVSVGGHYEALLAQCGVTHVRLDQKRRPLKFARAVLRFGAIVRSFAPDVVHAHMVTGMVLAVIARLAGRYRLISTVHNIHDASADWMGCADRVIAVSRSVAASMERRGIPARKLRVVSNGTLGSRRTLPLVAYPPENLARPAITTVAGMDKRKGIDILIRAFADVVRAVPEANLYIVGDGPERAAFEREANRSPAADRIHFAGFQAEPQRYLRASDIFVLASLRESFGLVLPEAREAGCAIVASAVDGIPEALDGGEAGLLVRPGDAGELAKTLIALLSDPPLLERWRRRAGHALDQFGVERVYTETLGVYLER